MTSKLKILKTSESKCDFFSSNMTETDSQSHSSTLIWTGTRLMFQQLLKAARWTRIRTHTGPC